MKIFSGMPLHDLAERLGSDATEDDAEAMRSILLFEGWEGSDTQDIPEGDWLRMALEAIDHSDEPSLGER